LTRRFTFRARHRISHARDFQAVFAAKLTKPVGPITLHARVTDHAEPRLGLSIGRRFGPAHARGAFKRRIRDAFRLLQHDLPRPEGGGAYDFVITARAHSLLNTADYQTLFAQGAAALHNTVTKRVVRQKGHAND